MPVEAALAIATDSIQVGATLIRVEPRSPFIFSPSVVQQATRRAERVQSRLRRSPQGET
jgi:hypothetical protein